MNQEKQGNWRRFCFPAGLALCAAAILAAQTGCSPQHEEPVIAERTSQADMPQNGQKDSGAEVENQPGGDEQKKSLAEQTEAPDRYRTQLKSGQLELRADVPVSVPDVLEAPVLSVKGGLPYKAEDFNRFKETVRNVEGVIWGENELHEEENGGYISCTSEDGHYYVSFRDKGDVPFIWLNRQEISYGNGDSFDSTDISGMALNGEPLKKKEQELADKAKQLLKGIGLEDFTQTPGEWRALSRWVNGKWEPDGRYALVMQYAGTAGGITQPVDRSAVWGEIPPRAQYVDIVYADDGELIEFKDIDHVEYGEVVKESGFLLPFSAVAEIFEQYAKSFYETHKPGYEMLQDKSQRPILTDDMKACAYVTLTDVRLEYRAVYGETGEAQGETEDGAKYREGTLEPVWNFYGGILVGYQKPDGLDSGITKARLTAEDDLLLVSISAADGRVYGR